MDRREALKGLGLSLGYMVATPTVISLLQSCKNDIKNILSWTPEFLTNDEAIVVESLVNLILPKVEGIPGASDVNVTQFIDLYTAKVSGEEDQSNFRKGLNAVIKALGKPVKQLKNEDYDKLLSKFLRANPQEQEAFRKNESDVQVLETLIGLRGSTVWAYKTSELVGEDVLVYDPVPGEQIGCMTLEDATGGRAWSLP